MAKVVEGLVRGRDWTKQLQILIQNPCDDEMSLSQQKELVHKIYGSFSEAISGISSGSCEYSGEIPVSLQFSGDRRSVDSGQSFKRPAVKNPRNGYRKRKSLDSWINISSSMVDEYAWRKYGQKEILSATFPRSYFRCTHKYDQGCKATKQVQRIQEEPIKYQITYSGKHTCSKTLQNNVHDISTIFDSFSQESKQVIFQSNTPSEIYPSPSCPDSTKEENTDLEVQSDYTSDLFTPSDLTIWPDLMPLMRSDISEDFLPGVYSYDSSIGSHGIDMDLFSQCSDFENDFRSY